MPAGCTGQEDCLFARLSHPKCLMPGLAQGNADMRAWAQKNQHPPPLLPSGRKGAAFPEGMDLSGGHHNLKHLPAASPKPGEACATPSLALRASSFGS